MLPEHTARGVKYFDNSPVRKQRSSYANLGFGIMNRSATHLQIMQMIYTQHKDL